MKPYIIANCIVLLVCLLFNPVSAQTSRTGHDRHIPSWSSRCTALEDFELSTDQLAVISEIKAQYKDQIMKNYQDCMLKKIELRTLLRNSNSDEKMIMEKSKELPILRNQLYNMMIEYQVRIRKILSPEQRRDWCTMMELPVFHGGW